MSKKPKKMTKIPHGEIEEDEERQEAEEEVKEVVEEDEESEEDALEAQEAKEEVKEVVEEDEEGEEDVQEAEEDEETEEDVLEERKGEKLKNPEDKKVKKMRKRRQKKKEKGINPEALGEAGASPPFIQCCASWRNNAPIPLDPSSGKEKKWRPTGLPARGMDKESEEEVTIEENPGARPWGKKKEGLEE